MILARITENYVTRYPDEKKPTRGVRISHGHFSFSILFICIDIDGFNIVLSIIVATLVMENRHICTA